MNNHAHSPEDDALPATGEETVQDDTTSLPFLRSWKSVYGFVTAVFLLYVILLTILSRVFA
jgi:hypothetical protein